MKIIQNLSNNFRGNQIPDRLIIHAMAEEVTITEEGSKWFKDKKGKDVPADNYPAWEWLNDWQKRSAHYLIYPDGSVCQMLNEDQLGWHAKNYNSGSIGIEVLVNGQYDYDGFVESIRKDWVSQEQYETLIELSNDIIDRHNIVKNRIVRHSDLDYPRKVDPGVGFKWQWYKDQLL